MLRYERLPLRRTEVDSSVAELNTYSVATIEYDPDHPSLLIPTDFAGDKTQVSSKPIVIHAYDLTGGKTTFERFLSCYEGNCVFYNTYDRARTAVSQGELREHYPL